MKKLLLILAGFSGLTFADQINTKALFNYTGSPQYQAECAAACESTPFQIYSIVSKSGYAVNQKSKYTPIKLDLNDCLWNVETNKDGTLYTIKYSSLDKVVVTQLKGSLEKTANTKVMSDQFYKCPNANSTMKFDF